MGRDPSVQGDDQLRLSLRQRSRHAEYGARHKCYSVKCGRAGVLTCDPVDHDPSAENGRCPRSRR